MPFAYVLVNTEVGSEDEVTERLKKIGGVEEVYKLWSVYDIIVRVREDTADELTETLTEYIRKTKGVRSTVTLTGLNE